MGDEAGERAARDRAVKWNNMLDLVSGYQAGDVTAEAALDAVTEYIVSIHNIRIDISDE